MVILISMKKGSRLIKRYITPWSALFFTFVLSVCMCARFQANPKECHWIVVNRILWYLVHTHNLGLWYPKGFTFDLLGYFDSDYARCKVDRKSTTGTCQFLGRSLVSWSSKKQNSVALSTAEAKCAAEDACCAQLLWMKQTLSDFGCEFIKIPLLCNNESAIKLANNPVIMRLREILLYVMWAPNGNLPISSLSLQMSKRFVLWGVN
jgi:hypothetical protein